MLSQSSVILNSVLYSGQLPSQCGSYELKAPCPYSDPFLVCPFVLFPLLIADLALCALVNMYLKLIGLKHTAQMRLQPAALIAITQLISFLMLNDYRLLKYNDWQYNKIPKWVILFFQQFKMFFFFIRSSLTWSWFRVKFLVLYWEELITCCHWSSSFRNISKTCQHKSNHYGETA